MSIYASRKFWSEAADRALKTAAQAPLLAWGVGDVAMNAFDLDWSLGLGLALGGALFSLLTSVGSANIGEAGTASVIG